MTIYLVYRDVSEKDRAGTQIKNGFERLPALPHASMIREGVLPGEFGFPDLHFTHISYRSHEPENLHLFIIAYTNHALSRDERRAITLQAIEFITPTGKSS